MLDFNEIKFFGINTRTSKILRPIPVRINTDGAAKGNHDLATCGDIFRGSMREFLEVQMVVEFYGVIHAMEEAQKMGLTNV